MKRTYCNIYHISFLLILITHYLLSFILFDGIIFGQETDVFEHEILFNRILGDIYNNDYYILDSLLDGNYEWFYFTRALYVINYLYSFFSTENAFLIIDIFCKIVAYISFFKLSRLIDNKIFYSFLIAGIYSYASTTTFTDYHSSIFGFGSAILPYLAYLSLKKKDLKIKNYLIIIFTAINSHFYFGIFYLLVPIILYLHDNSLSKIKTSKIFIIFSIFCFIANSNLFYLAFLNDITFQRDEWQTTGISIYHNIIYFLDSLFFFPLHFPSIELNDGETFKILYFTVFFNEICLFLTYTLTFILLISNKIKNSKLFVVIIFGILLISFISKTHLYNFAISYLDIGIAKTIQMTRIKVILTFVILFALLNIKIKELNKFVFSILIFIFLILQINHMILPAFKKFINYNSFSYNEKVDLKFNLINFNFSKIKTLINKNSDKETNNMYLTIDNYYDTNSFSDIKRLVKNDYVLPIDINPAKLIYNRINTVGGYFQFSPKFYRNDFEKIIINELDKDVFKKEDYDVWGLRLFAFVVDNKNVDLDFEAMKKMKISYLLSKQKLFHENFQIICETCNDNKDLNLYLLK
tara:strand:+ start:262 stop:2004 length:1743 start_codon:yes stop_codon:yes gene_type:complete